MRRTLLALSIHGLCLRHPTFSVPVFIWTTDLFQKDVRVIDAVVEIITNPFGGDKGHDDRQTKGHFVGGFDQNDRQANGHAYNSAEESSRTDKSVRSDVRRVPANE